MPHATQQQHHSAHTHGPTCKHHAHDTHRQAAAEDPLLAAPRATSLWTKPGTPSPVKPLHADGKVEFNDHTKIPIEAFNDDWKVMAVPDHGYQGRTTWRMYRDTPDMAIGLATVPPGREFEQHWHSYPETYYGMKGDLKTRTDDKVYTDLDKGSTLVIPSMAMHHTVNRSQGDAQFAYFIGDFRLRQGPNTKGWGEATYELPEKHTAPRDTRKDHQPKVKPANSGARLSLSLQGKDDAFRFETMQDDAEVGFGEGVLQPGMTLPKHYRPVGSYLLPLSGSATMTTVKGSGSLHAEQSVYIPAGAEVGIQASDTEAFRFLLFTAKAGNRDAGQVVWSKTLGD